MTISFPDGYSIQDLDGKFLWKYLDLFKLIDLLQSNQLHFTRFDHFEDALEGITGRGIGLKFYTDGEPLTEENINPQFTLEEQKRIIAEDQQFRLEFETGIQNSQQSQYGSCWFLGDKESLAMWKLYSKKDGVALRFSARQLADTIIASAESYTNSDFDFFYCGPVDYKNIWPFDMHETFPGKFNGLKKDKSYIHESEFRFVAAVSGKNLGKHDYLKLPIGKISVFDVNIIANPFMEKWQYDNLRMLLDNFQVGEKLQKSKMVLRK